MNCALPLLLFAASASSPAADLPDLASRGGLRIGTTLVPWGNPSPVEIKGAEAVQAGDKACAFNATYEMTNLGGAPTGASFTNRLRVGDASVLATNSGLTLAARETKSVTTAPYLPVGTHTIELSLDDDGNVAESNETNNRVRVRYELKGPCGPQAPPPAVTPGRR